MIGKLRQPSRTLSNRKTPSIAKEDTVQPPVAILVKFMLSLCLTLVLTIGMATGQHMVRTLQEKLAGTWKLVSSYDENEGGEDIDPFGSNPTGQLTLNLDGHFSLQIIGSNLKFASNDRLRGTGLENQASVQGSLAYFGRYSVNAGGNTLSFHVERCTFPNWNSTDRTTSVTLSSDKLEFASAVEPSLTGSFSSHLVWKRAN